MKNGGAITADVGAPSDYERRKELEVCTYPGCDKPPDARPGEESNECEKHHEGTKQRKRRSRRRRRRIAKLLIAKRAAKRQCLRCGGKRLSGEKHCAKCLLAAGDIETKARVECHKSGDKKADRIELNTSVDASGRSRYRGQGRRGRQSVAAVDATDLAYASDALKRGVDGLAYAASPTVAALPRIQREDLRRASEGEILLAYRFLGEVLARHRVIAPVVVEDED